MNALERLIGDDTARAKAAFRGLSQEEMQEEHGCSGKTRAEILQGYEEYDAMIRTVIAYAEMHLPG